MSAPYKKRKTPAATGAEKNAAKTSLFCLNNAQFVKQHSHVLTCGMCALFREKSQSRRRGFCRFTREVVWAETRCDASLDAEVSP